MNCQEIRDQFSPWLDGQFNSQEIDTIEVHLNGCKQCQEEFLQWQRISGALKSLGKETDSLLAPAGFEALVMQQVSQLAKRRSWINRNLRKLVASAAALALLTYGSLDLVPQFFNGNPSTTIAEHGITGTKLPGDNAGLQPTLDPTDNPVNNGVNNNNEPNSIVTDPSNPVGETNSDPLPGDPNSATTNNSDPSINPTGSERLLSQPGSSFSVAQANPTEPMGFLNKDRTITSTLIRLKVADLLASQTKAQNAGKNLGAEYKVFDVQSGGGGQRTIIRFTIPRTKTNTFIETLADFGSVIERQDENEAITARFAETLEQYRALVAQLNESSSPKQQEQLRSQIKTLEQQLMTWDEEADEQIIMLSLEH